MRVVVTGGAGYIGSTAVASLVERGDDVVAIDNLSQGHQEALPSSVPLLRIDICDRSAVTSALHQYHPDAVLHFAALTIAPESVRDPAPYWRVNAGGTLNVLDAMRDAGIPAIVFSSTAAVYGTPERVPIPKTLHSSRSTRTAPRSSQQSGPSRHTPKRMASPTRRCAISTSRACRAIGEDHRPETHLIPSALDAAAGRREPLAVFGTDFPTADGTAIRDYVHVEDLIDAHLLALDRVVAGDYSLGPINLGTRDGASVGEVLDAVDASPGRRCQRPQPDVALVTQPVLVADASRANEAFWAGNRSARLSTR